MASPSRPTDLPKSTHDTTYFSFGCKNIRDCILFLVDLFRIFAPDRKQVDFGRGNGSFPVGSDSREKNGKKGGFGPEKQVKNGFSTV